MSWAWIAQHADGPAALSLTRQKLPNLVRPSDFQNEDVWRGAYRVSEPAEPPRVVLLASGSEVSLACDAAAKLAGEALPIHLARHLHVRRCLGQRLAELVGDDAATQAEGAIRNLQAVLEAAGSSLDQVLKCTVFLVDMGEFAAVNEVYGRFFTGDSPPARACVEVSGLPKGALFEIDCVALA